MNKIEEKLDKEKINLEKLIEIKKENDEKIKKTEHKIADLEKMLKQQKFSAADDVIRTKGLTIDEIMQAIKNNDLLSLQEKLEKSNNSNNDSNN